MCNFPREYPLSDYTQKQKLFEVVTINTLPTTHNTHNISFLPHASSQRTQEFAENYVETRSMKVLDSRMSLRERLKYASRADNFVIIPNNLLYTVCRIIRE